MSDYNEKISYLIEKQIPQFVREEYPNFLNFIKAYYRFLEDKAENGLIVKSKELLSISDVDKSLDQFEDYFYKTFLNLFPKDVLIDKAFLIKNVLPFYREKGNEDSFKFLFLLLYGDNINIRYPRDDIIRASGGNWQRSTFFKIFNDIKSVHTGFNGQGNNIFTLAQTSDIEDIDVYVNGNLNTSFNISSTDEKSEIIFNNSPANNSIIEIVYNSFNISKLENRKVTGKTSGAYCLIETATKKYQLGREFFELKINNKTLHGNFLTNEKLLTDFFVDEELIYLELQLLSNLRNLRIIDSGSKYNIGDSVIIIGDATIPAKAIVSKVVAGTVDRINIENGGSGFQSENQVYIPEIDFDFFEGSVDLIDDSGEYSANSINVFIDLISSQDSVSLNSSNYNFSQFPTANLNTSLDDALTPLTISPIGPITKINLKTSKIGIVDNKIDVISPKITILESSSWKQVSVGLRYSAAIRSDDTLWLWGDNTQGQLGDGTTTQKISPILVGGANSSWKMIRVYDQHTLAINNSGTLFAWGDNTNGQLGDGTTISKLSPVQIGNDSWIQVTAGRYHSVGINSSNKLFTWGYNLHGQLGDNTAGPGTNKSSPVQIGNDSWIQISAGENFTLAMNSSNNLFTWGNNDSGQLGIGTITSRSSPVQITGSWIQVSAGKQHVQAILNNNTLWTWGNNTNGALGNIDTVNKSSPVSIVAINPAYSWHKISSGSAHTAAIRSDGTLWTWGINTSGQLGDGTVVAKSSPVQIGSQSWIQVSAGVTHTAAINSSNTIFSWGGNSSGQLGDGTVVAKSSPVQIGSQSWIQVSAGYYHTAAINSSNTLFTWGLNLFASLGDNTVTNRSSPTQIGSQSWIQVSAGYSHTAAINSSNKLFTWGWNSNGQLGDGTVANKSSPVQIGSESWIQVSAGGTHTAAINSSNKLFTWGRNDFGQLGDGTGGAGVNRSSPVQIGSQSWIQVSAAAAYTAAINSSNTLFTWGSNGNGQLGDGTVVHRSSPVQIGTQSWNQVSIYNGHTSAIRSDEFLFTWGYNVNGQLGDSSVVSKSSPVSIGNINSEIHSWIQVSAGDDYSSGITSTDKLFTWGLNTSGQLGDGTVVTKSSPVQIGSNSWKQVDVGGIHTVAIKKPESTLYSWGDNVYGQLGINNPVSQKSSPTFLNLQQEQFESDLYLKEYGIIGTIEILNGGQYYNVGEKLIFNTNQSMEFSGYGAVGEITAVDEQNSNAITDVIIIDGGIGYKQTSLPQITVESQTGEGAEIVATSILGDGEILNPIYGNLPIGAILEVKILDYGFGYTADPKPNMRLSGDKTAIIEAELEDPIIEAPGQWLNTNSLLSTKNSKLEGKDYFIDYSYVISSKIEFQRYKNTLKNLIHPSGFINYSELQIENDNIITIDNGIQTNTKHSLAIVGTVFVSNNSNNIIGAGTKFVSTGILENGMNVAIDNVVATISNVVNDNLIYANSNFTINTSGQLVVIP